MREGNSPQNVFRFMQHRPPRPFIPIFRLALYVDTSLAHKILSVARVMRRSVAAEHAKELSGVVDRILESKSAKETLEVVGKVLAENGRLDDLRRELKASLGKADRREDRKGLSDALLAAKLAPVGLREEAKRLGILFRVYELFGEDRPEEVWTQSLAGFLAQPIIDEVSTAPAPADLSPATKPLSIKTISPPVTGKLGRLALTARKIERTVRELTTMDNPAFLHLEDSDAHPAMSLNERGRSQLSEEAVATLEESGLDLRLPVVRLVEVLELSLDRLATAAESAGESPESESTATTPLEASPFKVAGITDLLVVKQHLKKYERTDIAHVENVMSGETRSRTHRAFERLEESFLEESESSREKETELETADRFELNRETQRTIERDQKFGFGLSISGKYGPSVEFSSNAEAEISTSEEESHKSATSYAKDIVERSLEKVTDRVREERVRRMIREEEETNVHELKGAEDGHTVGIYQFLEKVYESQVFNYGIRQIFDFMVPEPASYIWHLERSPDAGLDLPQPPPPLEREAGDASEINPFNYRRLAALYGASGIQPPPVYTKRSTLKLKSPSEGSEKGQPRSIVEQDLPIPEGYIPYQAAVRPLALTDDDLTLGITVGRSQQVWKPSGAQTKGVGSGHDMASAQLTFVLFSGIYDTAAKLPIQVLAFETKNYALTVDVDFFRSTDLYSRWQLKTYEALHDAYLDMRQQYDQRVEELRAEAEAEAARGAERFGAPPSRNLTVVKSELKKHCITIVTRQRYDDFDATKDGTPPYFDFAEAAEEGAFVRFFEQAFEWDQLQYVCYPYFWARKNTEWADRFRRSDVDPVFLEFLQAGQARVVVPVRPGFEAALAHFLETGEIWNGQGDPPAITSPLYLPILTEIKERTGATKGELPVPEPWETRLPTPLAILRSGDDLPEWERASPDVWSWSEVEPS